MAKIENPIDLSLGNSGTIIKGCGYPLEKGIMIGKGHYGFTISVEGNQTKYYPTEGALEEIKIQDDYLKIFEEGKYTPWIFDRNGNLIDIASLMNQEAIVHLIKQKIKRL